MELEDLYDDKPLEPKKPAPEGERVVISLQEAIATATSRVMLGAILFFAFIVGAYVAGTALHDPDTCWLLGLGRWMWEHKALPEIDPFSWTFAVEEAKGRSFILYQWLSELIFYLATLPAGLLTLLMLNAVVIVTAFISLPIGFIVRRGAPFLAGLAVVTVGVLAGSFHFLSRPEIFSYLLIALFLQVVHYARVTAFMPGEKMFRISFVLIPLMVLWANLHTGFITGLAILGGALLGALAGNLIARAQNRALIVELALALAGCTLATLVTPYGLRLWAYIPDLFGSPINKYIVELKPITLNSIANPIYWPFVALTAALVLFLLREIIAVKRAGNLQTEASAFTRAELITSFIIGAIAVYLGFKAQRLSVFTALIIEGEIIALLGLRRLITFAFDLKARYDAVKDGTAGDSNSASEVLREAADLGLVDAFTRQDSLGAAAEAAIENPSPASPKDSSSQSSEHARIEAASLATVGTKRTLLQEINRQTLDVWLTGGAFELAIVSFCAIAGVCLIATRVAPPVLPASHSTFKAPDAAVAYIESNLKTLPDKLFNDPQYGDMLIWKLRGAPKVFIDTRFDMYGANIVSDFIAINECQTGWREKLDKSGVDWLFVKEKSPVAVALLADPGWEKKLQGDGAVILFKK